MSVVTVNGMTAEAMEAIRDQTIIDADIVANHLILTRYDATTIDAGSIVDMTWPSVSILEATTSPEGSLTANPGAMALRTDGSWWLKATGTGSTGWIRAVMPGSSPTVVCTSSTRPSGPTVGMRIYETDTGKTLIYLGATTQWKPPWYDQWTDTNVENTPSAVLSTSGTTATILSTGPTFTPGAINRKMEIRALVTVSSSIASDIFQVEIRNTNTTGTVYVQGRHTTTGQQMIQMVGRINLTTTTPVTPVMVFTRLSGTGTLSTLTGINAYWSVSDVGPSGIPPGS